MPLLIDDRSVDNDAFDRKVSEEQQRIGCCILEHIFFILVSYLCLHVLKDVVFNCYSFCFKWSLF